MSPDEIQQLIDDTNTRIDDGEQSLQDLSDNTDSVITDQQSTIDDHSTTLDDLSANSGQLTFPLSQDTIDLIKEIYPNGQITLVGGVYTLIDSRISQNSIILITCAGLYGTMGSGLIPQVIVSTGSAQIVGTGSGDTSVYNYLILS